MMCANATSSGARSVKICLGQINTTPGDFEGNFARICKGVDAAIRGGAELLVFPELTIPGYLGQDLVYHPAYLEHNAEYLARVAEYAGAADPALHVVVGFIARNEAGEGKPFLNSAALLRGGEVIATYVKQLLPFYDVFDELRYFEPGRELTIVEIAGVRVGLAICEDLWNDKGSDGYSYRENPLARYQDAGVDLVLSINSSPYIQGKVWQRISRLAGQTQAGPAIVYVNQCGGQDELVFDGHSFVAREGDLLHLARDPYRDTYDVVDLDGAPLIAAASRPESRPRVEEMSASLFDMLVVCLRDYVQKSGFSELVVASSGGVDSALVVSLACAAVGPERVHAIRLPSIFTSGSSTEDAQELHRNLGCWDYEVPIDHAGLVEMLNSRFAIHSEDPDNLVSRVMQAGDYAGVADENIQARLRDLYVMHFSNAFGALPLATGNKTESACGYYTHYDMNFAFAPIKDLYKYEVVQLVRANTAIPENIWRKPPTAELSAGQEDETALMPYACLDPIVKAHIEAYISTFEEFRAWARSPERGEEEISGDPERLASWLADASAREEYERIIRLIGRMEYKRRQTCPGTKVSRVAFGIGRRIPVVERWS